MKIHIYPELFNPLTGEKEVDEELQEQARTAMVEHRKEDIEIVYEEV